MLLQTDNSESLVSVIIPAYNAGKFIGDTIRSVLTQEHSNLELIVVNDGSTDNTEEVIRDFSEDSRLRYIPQENRGCSGAKNTGLKIANGRFIQFLDADDVLSADKIAEQVKQISTDSLSVAVCKTICFSSNPDNPQNREIDTEFLYDTDNTLDFILNLYGLNGRNGMIQPNAFLITREIAEVAGPYDVSISPAPDEDGEYFCRVMLASKRIYYSPNGVNYYRKPDRSGDSLSKQISHQHAKGSLRSLQLTTKHLLKRENSERIKTLMAGHFASFIYNYSVYPNLGKLAEREIASLGVRKIPPAGGRNFRKLSDILGWHNALFLKNLTAKLKRRLSR